MLKGDAPTYTQEVSFLPGDPLNTSTHVPVVCRIPEIAKQIQDDHTSESRNKIQWEKLDKARYRRQVEADVKDIPLDTASSSDLNTNLQSFCEVLVSAAERHAPHIRSGKEKRYWS